MDDKQSIKKKRQDWLDVARTIAIISISCNHAIHRAFLNAAGDINLVENSFRGIIQVFSRLGVPLFLMISGVLLLNKRMRTEKDVKRFYYHNLTGIFVTAEIWYGVMFWFRTLGGANDILKKGLGYTLFRFIQTLLFMNQESFESMWYMPMILCIYLLIPWVNVAVHTFKPHYIVVPITIVILSSMVFENINEFFVLSGSEYQIDFTLQASNLFSMYLVYVILGYYVGKGLLNKVPLVFVITICLLSFVISSLYQVIRYARYDAGDLKYNFFFIGLAAMTLFELIRRAQSIGNKQWIQYISRISFGIYFVHIFIMTVLVKLPVMARFNSVLKFALYEVVSVGVSIIIIRLSATIPLFKKYLYLIK